MNGNEESPLVEKKTEPASSREKSEPRHSKADSPGRPVRRPSMSMHAVIKHRGHRQRRSIATSRAPVPTRHLSPAAVARAGPRRAGPEKREPELVAFSAARPRAPSRTHPLRDEERHRHPPSLLPPAPAWGTQSWPLPSSPHDGSEKRRAGPDGRRERASRGRLLDRRPTTSTAPCFVLCLPRPIRLIQRAPCIESCMEMEAQGFTSNPTDLCLCPSQSACLSVRSVHPFPSTGDRSIIGRGLHGRSPSQ
jgi:hypothetical protein